MLSFEEYMKVEVYAFINGTLELDSDWNFQFLTERERRVCVGPGFVTVDNLCAYCDVLLTGTSYASMATAPEYLISDLIHTVGNLLSGTMIATREETNDATSMISLVTSGATSTVCTKAGTWYARQMSERSIHIRHDERYNVSVVVTPDNRYTLYAKLTDGEYRVGYGVAKSTTQSRLYWHRKSPVFDKSIRGMLLLWTFAKNFNMALAANTEVRTHDGRRVVVTSDTITLDNTILLYGDGADKSEISINDIGSVEDTMSLWFKDTTEASSTQMYEDVVNQYHLRYAATDITTMFKKFFSNHMKDGSAVFLKHGDDVFVCKFCTEKWEGIWLPEYENGLLYDEQGSMLLFYVNSHDVHTIRYHGMENCDSDDLSSILESICANTDDKHNMCSIIANAIEHLMDTADFDALVDGLKSNFM